LSLLGGLNFNGAGLRIFYSLEACPWLCVHVESLNISCALSGALLIKFFQIYRELLLLFLLFMASMLVMACLVFDLLIRFLTCLMK
jgi:hypothetical protein